MARLLRSSVIRPFVVTLLLLSPRLSTAGDWDLNLARLCRLETDRPDAVAQAVGTRRIDCGGGYSRASFGNVTRVHPDNAAFRALMSELGTVFVPNILAPAETFGFNGYTLAAEFGFTSVNRRKNTTHEIAEGRGFAAESRPHRFWRAAQSVSDAAFSSGDTQQTGERIDRELPSAIAPTVSVMARKGFWMPPSFEIGVGARHLLDSRLWAALVQAKLALHEGFQGFPLPAIAVRGTGSHVFGSDHFSLSIAGLDFSMSKHFGVASTFVLMPYAGYQLIWIVADSGVIDATPGIDAIAETAAKNAGAGGLAACAVPDCNANFTFDDQADIIRHRLFIGLRANFYISSLLVEYSYFAAGAASDPVRQSVNFESEIADGSGAQHSVSFSLALDF